MMLKKLLISVCLLAASPAFGQNVQYVAPVTPGHVAVWNTAGVIADGGSSASSPVTSFGVTNNGGAGICVNSAATTSSGYNALCLGASTSAPATISLQNYGTAPAESIQFVINGVTQGFPTVAAPVTVGDYACFSTTAGALKDCSSTILSDNISYTPPYTHGVTETQTAYNAQRTSIADFGAKGDTIVLSDGAISSSGTGKAFSSASASFTAADVGKIIRIVGAGAAGAVLETKIAAVVSSTAVTTSAAASTTVTGAQTFYGTDDTTAIQNAVSSVTLRANPSCVLIPGKIYLTTVAITVPQYTPLCLTGIGGSGVSSLGSIIQPSILVDGIDVQTSETVTFRDFGIIYAGPANSSTAAIKVSPPASTENYYSNIFHVTIWNAYDGINADRLAYSVIDSVGMQTISHVPVTYTNTFNGDIGDNKLVNSTFLMNSGSPVCIYWTGGGGLTAFNNKCSLGVLGVQLNPATGVTTSQIVIQNNSFDGQTTAGVIFQRQDGTSSLNQLVVSGNTCNLFNATAASCVSAPTDINGVGLTNLVVTGNTVYGPSVGNTMFAIDSVTNTIVSNNTLQSHSASTNGIVIGSAVVSGVIGPNSLTGSFSVDWSNASSSYKVSNAIQPNSGGILYSTSDRLAILNGTATASLPLLSANVSAPTWATISYPTSATSGGIPYFSSATALSSSAVMSANAIVVGGGAGAAPVASGCSVVASTNNLTCSSASSFAPNLSVLNTTSDANGPQITVSKNRSGGNTNSGDALGYFVFQGFANSAQRSAAVLQASQAAASSGSNVPSKIQIMTSNSAGLQNQQLTFDSNGHSAVTAQASAPTISAGCNGAGSSISGAGGVANDTHGTVVGQTSAATTCTVSFGASYTNAPDCVFSGFQSPITVVNSVGTGSFQVTFASTANYKFSYTCRGI